MWKEVKNLLKKYLFIDSFIPELKARWNQAHRDATKTPCTLKYAVFFWSSITFSKISDKYFDLKSRIASVARRFILITLGWCSIKLPPFDFPNPSFSISILNSLLFILYTSWFINEFDIGLFFLNSFNIHCLNKSIKKLKL